MEIPVIQIGVEEEFNESIFASSLTVSCLSAAQLPWPEQKKTYDCYEPYQQHVVVYRGRVSITKSGKTCKRRTAWDHAALRRFDAWKPIGVVSLALDTVQRWDDMDPDEDFTPWQYPAAYLESNYCRTPDVDFSQTDPPMGTPWCYTD
eukprot:2809589-Pyramimonas_sp.AAC.1